MTKPVSLAILQRSSPKSNGLKSLLDKWNERGEEELQKRFRLLIERPRQLNIPSPQIRDTGEKAYQRAFYDGKKTTLRLKNLEKLEIQWLDYEVPVIFGKNARRSCLDLIGKISREYVIAELKDTNGNSPFYALFEVLEYALLIEKLLSSKDSKQWPPYHGKDDKNDYWKNDCKCTSLIVAAPKKYWTRWRGTNLERLERVSRWVEDELIEDKKYKVIFAEFENEDFKAQRKISGKKTYTPRLVTNKENIWQEIWN